MIKRTKIITTIGPVTEKYEQLEKLGSLGVDIFRLNFSHGDHSWHKKVIQRIKKLNRKTQQNFAIILDTKGPELRTGDVKSPIKIKKGDKILLTPEFVHSHSKEKLSVNYDLLAKDVEVGEIILVDNGVMCFKVLEIQNKNVLIEVLEGGILESRRHLNIPGKEVSLKSITQKDWDDINFGIELNVDFIALSFVRTAEDIKKLKKYLIEKKSKIEIIAKIESFEATKHLDEIIKHTDAVMVARGDLGAEIPFYQVPKIQQDIISLAAKYKKPVIVATHMLESMIEHPIPTRAEATDIFEAVQQKADCTMLSGETAGGKFPFKAVKAMTNVIKESEKNLLKKWNFRHLETNSERELFAKISAEIANTDNNISAIIVITRSGFTAKITSSFRPIVPIFALTNTPSVKRKSQILWGTEGIHIDFSKTPNTTIKRAEKKILEKYPKLKNTSYVLLSDTLVDNEYIPAIQIRKFK